MLEPVLVNISRHLNVLRREDAVMLCELLMAKAQSVALSEMSSRSLTALMDVYYSDTTIRVKTENARRVADAVVGMYHKARQTDLLCSLVKYA